MSKIGEKPILINKDCGVTVNDEIVTVKGPLGEVKLDIPLDIKVLIEDGKVLVQRVTETKKAKSNHGTMARLINNALVGTTAGFTRNLEVVGTGFWTKMEGDNLVLSVGFSHNVNFTTPPGVKISTKENTITITGVDKQNVGWVADRIKKIKKPDAYKGKGIRYQGEKIKLKPGKAVAKATTAGGK